MGRILETLSQAEPKRVITPEPALTIHACPLETDVAGELVEGDVPYIEVGGPRRIIEASPDVLACAPPPGIRLLTVSPEEQREPTPAPSAAVVRRFEPGLKSVTFRPLSPDQLPPAPGRLAPELIAFHQPDHPLSEGYRSLLNSITAQLAAGQSQVVLFTAPSAGVGNTTVLLNLAITAARRGGVQVAVVDANGHHPAVARRLGLSAAQGLREVLAGKVSLQQGLQKTGQEHLQALTAGKAGEDGTVRLVAEAMPLVLRLLREQFPLVFVDAPPWNDDPETALLASACDAVYLVVEQGRAEAPEVEDLLGTMRRHGIPLGGCILTQ